MRKKLLYIIFILYSFISYSQNAQDIIDKLKVDLKSNPDAKKTASIYSDLTWYYSNVATDSALAYGKKALFEASKLKDSILLAQIYSDLGAVYFRRSEFQNCRMSYLTALKIRKLRNDKLGIAKINLNLANVYNKENYKQEALKNYLEGVDFFEKANNQQIVAVTKANIGSLFNDLKNYAKAKAYLQDAIAYQEKNQLDEGLSTSYLSMGNVYLKLKDTLTSIKYYEKCIASSKKSGNNLSLSSALNNLGSIKSQQKKSAEASAIFNKSKALRDTLDLKTDESILSLAIAKEHIMYGRFNEANKVLNQLKNQYSKSKNFDNNLFEVYHFFILSYGYLKIPDSVEYYSNLTYKMQDSVIKINVNKQTNELEAKYQTTKKEKQLLVQEADVKKKETIIFGLAILAVFLSIVGFLIYRQQKLKNFQQTQEFKLKTAIARVETQNKLQAQRLNISRDLHDNIGAQLTFIISSVDAIKYAFDIQNPKLNNKLKTISDFTKTTIIELRDTIWAMNSTEITFEELRSRILNFIEKAQEATENIDFKFTIDDKLKEYKFSSIKGMNIYRTIQEAINNAIKYAGCTQINVIAKSENKTLTILIVDNGKGFDIENSESGNGLQNMKKRMEEINATFQIKSGENNGTVVLLTIPATT
ncbi:MAG: sensor histidine kinase [Flavobacterium sp.]|nr:sensor histidine kinase [Flavobacterium sp.]